MGKLADLLLEESDFMPKYQIYCDMDGVLTDFEKRFVTLLQQEGPKYYSKATIAQVTRPKHFDKLEGTEEFWKFIDQHIGLEFWSDMEWMPNGRELWNFIQPYGPKLLTSPSRDNTSRLGKRLWVKENLVPAPAVLFRFGDAKSDFANENAILIDDKPSNLVAFASKGGIAIEVKDGEIQSVINKLKQLGYGKGELT
jgi:FMN phosphatase YigB (HAD superfamily)